MPHYDYIFAGGGAAGLNLACHLVKSPLNKARILIVDREPKTKNDRTWCYWSHTPHLFSEIEYHSWRKLVVRDENTTLNLVLQPYQYNLIRGIDYYNYARKLLESNYVDFIIGNIDKIHESASEASIEIDGKTISGTWIFDSRFLATTTPSKKPGYNYLLQHFTGWEIETAQNVFDPTTATMFDFRTPQFNSMRFIYVLPFSAHRALVEYTIFSSQLLADEEYRLHLRDYLQNHLSLSEYSILHEEKGVIPMTDIPFPRNPNKRILRIGTQGGRVKPSSGYAFLRIQNDSKNIVQSLIKHQHPFDLPKESLRYKWFDSLLLEILAQNGEYGKTIFMDLFSNNPAQRIFRFLDESDPFIENLKLILSLSPLPFLKSLLPLVIKRLLKK